MAYIAGLLILIAVIFSATTGSNLLSTLWNKTTQTVNGFLFPKSQKEILIDNLNSQNDSLDTLLSQAASGIMNNKNVSQDTKNAFQGAIQAAAQSKNLTSQIQKLNQKDKSVVKALIDKILNPTPDQSPEPTYIPPQCHLECAK